MAIKPRIHWAWDGSKMWNWDYNSSWTLENELTQDNRNLLDGDELESDTYNPGGNSNGMALQLPDNAQIHSIKWKSWQTHTLKIWVSAEEVPNDYSPVGDPQWTQVLDANYTVANIYTEFSLSPITNARWILFGLGGSVYWMSIHLFGEYTIPNFEFWNEGETAEFNNEQIPFDLPNAPNSVDYHQYLNFKLKNTDSSPHDYSLTIGPVKYGGDTLITNNFKLAKYSDGYLKSGTITLSNIAAGAFSENLRVYADILKNANPADGRHYYVIDVTETA